MWCGVWRAEAVDALPGDAVDIPRRHGVRPSRAVAKRGRAAGSVIARRRSRPALLINQLPRTTVATTANRYTRVIIGREIDRTSLRSVAHARFRTTIPSVEVLRSDFRHGVKDQDIQHAMRAALLVEEIDDDPARYLVLGPDRAGNMLELVVLDRPEGPAVMHAMSMRAKYLPLLDRRS
jgi:hypothetical protein